MKKKLIGLLVFCLLLCSFGTVSFGAEKTVYPYYVTVNLTENIVTVYEKDSAGKYTVPVKAFHCSGGGYTPEGTFRTSAKYEWRPLFGDVWGRYATRITGHILFHSVPYFEKDKTTLEYEEYNKLGTKASAGCIRMTVEDVKWIYDNCPVGTTVKMYRGDVKEPLQPAPLKKIDVKDVSRRGWDPTDPDPANPWRKGELRQMQVQPSLLERVTDVYYEDGVYYLSAADAKELFAKLDIALDLPQNTIPAKDGSVKLIFGEQEYALSCRVYGDTVYYKIRDLAGMTGAEISWDHAAKAICLHQGEKEASLTRVFAVKDAVSLPAKIAAFFLD